MQSLIQENKPFIDFSSLNIRTKSQQPYYERIRVNQEEFKPLLDCELAFSRALSQGDCSRASFVIRAGSIAWVVYCLILQLKNTLPTSFYRFPSLAFCQFGMQFGKGLFL